MSSSDIAQRQRGTRPLTSKGASTFAPFTERASEGKGAETDVNGAGSGGGTGASDAGVGAGAFSKVAGKTGVGAKEEVASGTEAAPCDT